jgi:hypothetical protein
MSSVKTFQLVTCGAGQEHQLTLVRLLKQPNLLFGIGLIPNGSPVLQKVSWNWINDKKSWNRFNYRIFIN